VLASCVTDQARTRAPVTAGITDRQTWVCYDAAKDLIYGNPREVAARGCLGDDRRVTVEEASRLKKDSWLARPMTQVLTSERACRDVVTGKVYALPLKLMSDVDLKCVAGDEELAQYRVEELLREQRKREASSPATENAARANLEIVRQLSQMLTERRFAEADRFVAEIQSTGEVVTGINWLSQKINDGAGAAYVRAYIALVRKVEKSAKDVDETKDLAARMSAYLYMLATIDVAKCLDAKTGSESLVTVIQESKPAFEHLASVSRDRRDRSIAWAIAKEQQLAQRRDNDPWVCRYDAATTPAGKEAYADEATARQRQIAFRVIFPMSLAQLVEMMVHDPSRL
jgi:hypothetical protein